MYTTSIRRVGNTLGIALPKPFIKKHHLIEGDELYLVEMDEGFVLRPYHPKFAEWTETFERTKKKFGKTLKALAKSEK